LKLPDKIRNTLSRYFLDKSPEKNRRVKVTNFAQSISVGLIYKERNESHYILVKQYVKYLKEEHGIREVLAMAYIPGKEIPFWQTHKLEFDFFCKNDLDWRLKPASREVENFIAKDYDILIDLTLDTEPSLMYVLAKSRARFKVGAWNAGKSDLLDLMIDLKPNSTFDQYFHKLNHFLTILNKKHDPQPV
jgi:hypothetical protein